MDKLRMQTANKADENFRKLAAMFPNAVTETINENGEVVRAIDKDVLMQEIACTVVDGNEERYQFTWPDKKKSVLLANAPINKTLRPCREESVDFDTTENLYIEGDNLEVLKLLQETYLGKIKLVYIDPPYNTGSDAFVYSDDFAMTEEEFAHSSGVKNEVGERLFDIRVNNENNGRFHTDWLNMMYPRLRIAKDLLSEDGVLIMSIFPTIPLRANMTAPSSQLKRQHRVLIRRSLQRKPFRTMCSQTAQLTRASRESLLRIWTQQTRCVSMQSCQEPSKSLHRWATIRRTGQSLSMRARSSIFSS